MHLQTHISQYPGYNTFLSCRVTCKGIRTYPALCHLSSHGKTSILPGPLAPASCHNDNLWADNEQQCSKSLHTNHLSEPEHHDPLVRSEGLDTEEVADGECEGEGDVAEGSQEVGQEPGVKRL